MNQNDIVVIVGRPFRSVTMLIYIFLVTVTLVNIRCHSILQGLYSRSLPLEKSRQSTVSLRVSLNSSQSTLSSETTPSNASFSSWKMENLHLCLNGSATASPKLQIRRSVRSSGQCLSRQSPQLASLQLPLILWSFLCPLRSPLSLSPQPPLSHSAFLFRRTLQVQSLSLSLIFS